jgi:hypothetical protein
MSQTRKNSAARDSAEPKQLAGRLLFQSRRFFFKTWVFLQTRVFYQAWGFQGPQGFYHPPDFL